MLPSKFCPHTRCGWCYDSLENLTTQFSNLEKLDVFQSRSNLSFRRVQKPPMFFSFEPIEPRKKTLLLSLESWLVNRDPYVMVYEIIPVYLHSISSPKKNLNNQGPFFHCSSFRVFPGSINALWKLNLSDDDQAFWWRKIHMANHFP